MSDSLSPKIKFKKSLYSNFEATDYLNPHTTIDNASAVIDSSLGFSPYGFSPYVKAALQKVDYTTLTAYQEIYHDSSLLGELIKKWGYSGITKENVFFGHGAYNVLERIVYKLLEPCSMLGVGPQFPNIPNEAMLSGGSYHSIPFNQEFKFPCKELHAEIEQSQNHHGYSVIFLDNPNNPTGNFIDLTTIEHIAHAAEKQGICLIVDEAYGDFTKDEESAINLVPTCNNLMVVRSFSKAYGLASLRVGYCVVSDHIASYYRMIDVPFEPSLLSSIAASAALKDPSFIAKNRNKVAEEKKILTDGLTTMGFTILPTHPDVPIFMAHKPGYNVMNLFEQRGIKVIPGESFNKTNTLIDSSYARVRIPGSLEACKEILNRISNFV